MDVLVVGGGIGGLALAHGLLIDGHRVTVLERGDGPATGGAAVSIFSNGAAALAGLGVDVSDLGSEFEVLRTTSASGRPIMEVDLAPMRARTGFGVRAIARADLIGRLTDGLPAEVIRYGARVESARVDGPPAAVLTDGEAVRADVIVGADGYRSVVRRSVLGPPEAKPVGWDTWQGLTRILPGFAAGRIGRIVVGRAGMVGLLPAGEGRCQWWFDVRVGDLAPGTGVATQLRKYSPPTPSQFRSSWTGSGTRTSAATHTCCTRYPGAGAPARSRC
ncbi:FAD-dependent oxidoreductase [Cryptosporangium aurantiacum]|uniref:Lycopene cyclase protein n=1 Tax=Cryptosporangium aurantiacum TaxID=134849 RepID=A0A1M7R395_9ACTN|nr:FAD-dependent oxidoreductase [Cryptosporangium aurantiacum]SHN39298.1 Lycopene cyclase protein [Cryptosporangium aurantiacum]